MEAIVQHQEKMQNAPFFTADQERMILSNFLGGATRQEATVLLEIVKRRRLDPFARQVYFVKRWDSAKREDVWAIQISIDGLRSLAERTGKYDGQDEPEYGKDEAGEFAKVKVYRKDWTAGRAAVGIAYLSEFIQKKRDGTVTSFWQRMPRLMLAKCAEALAIRKAFPEDTAGLYIPEEMGEEPKAAPAELPPPNGQKPQTPQAPTPAADPGYDLMRAYQAPTPAAAIVEQVEAVTAQPMPAHVKPLFDKLLRQAEPHGPGGTYTAEQTAYAMKLLSDAAGIILFPKGLPMQKWNEGMVARLNMHFFPPSQRDD